MTNKTLRNKFKWLKRTLVALGVLVILLASALGIFIYKVRYGFPFYEDEIPEIELPAGKKHILLFSKANGFVHGDAIEAAKPALRNLAEKNGWFLLEFDEGGIFNEEQLKEFDLVIWNNVSGRVLTNEQRAAFQRYMEEGGSFIGLHASGDASHHWDWYTQNLIGAEFSHHPIEHQIQEATLFLQSGMSDSLSSGIFPLRISHSDEWYIFKENPAKKGFQVLYEMNGEKIDPSGNMLWIKDKSFGMGKKHPNMWFKQVGKGKTFYSALGHNATAYSNKEYLSVLENMMKWAVK